MRRGSVINYKKFSSNNLNTISSGIPSIFSRRFSSINSGLIKRTGAFTVQELISSMNNSNNENVNLIYRNRLTSNRLKTYKINEQDDHNENDDNKFLYDKDKKLMYFRKLIYKRTILDKHSIIYLKTNSNNKKQPNNKKIKEEQMPRMYHIYLINNILQKKRCTLFLRYEEMLKSIEGKDFLISYYGYKKINYMLIYLLGCIYNNDEFTYNKFNDERNIYENIIINYQNIIENMKDTYDEQMSSSYSFAFNEFITKINHKEHNHYISNKYYKYLFIQEFPSYFIPNCIPNYLIFENKIKKMIKSFIHKYKYRKIKTKYNIYLENKNETDNNNEIKKHTDKVVEEDDEEGNSEDNLELVNPHVNYYYNRSIFERSKRSFVYSKENINNKDGDFISLDNGEKLSSFMDSNLNKDGDNGNYIFTKGNFDNFIDQRLRNDNDVIEIEKMLENLGIKYNKDEKSENNKKYDNFVHSRNSSNRNILKFFIADEEIKRNKKKLFTSKPKIYDFDIQKNKLKNSLPSILKSNKDSNKETKTINNDNSSKNKNNNLKSASYGKKKNLTFHKEKKNINECYDFKRTIFKLISNRNFSSYNKKYDYDPKAKINEKLLNEKEKKQINKFLDKNNKFKHTLEFVYKSKENRKKFNKNNKLLCNLIVETQYNQKFSQKIFHKNSNEGKTKNYLTDNKIKIDNGEPGYNLSKIKYIFDHLEKKRNSENLIRQYHLKNAKTYRDVLKCGDIYF